VTHVLDIAREKSHADPVRPLRIATFFSNLPRFLPGPSQPGADGFAATQELTTKSLPCKILPISRFDSKTARINLPNYMIPKIRGGGTGCLTRGGAST